MRIGIDLGGTKIEGAALSPSGETLFRRRVPTPRNDYEGTLAAVAALVAEIEEKVDARGTVGVGIPGAMSPATGKVKNANSVWLIGKPLDRDLELRLGRPVRIANDANCFALSEALDGAARGAGTVFGVILGTGVGGGIVAGGAPIVGRNSIAGEWGHNPLPWPEGAELPGPPCYCGAHGCIETYLSGPGMTRDHLEATGRRLEAQEIAERAQAGEPDAEATMARYERRLARALAMVINILDPDCIVVGGGLSNATRLYDNVPRLWTPFVFSDTVATRLKPPAHGDSSGVRGAARLWPDA